jgi:hypothetical protein
VKILQSRSFRAKVNGGLDNHLQSTSPPRDAGDSFDGVAEVLVILQRKYVLLSFGSRSPVIGQNKA